MNTENNMKEGVVFKSAASGLWYENKAAAGDVDAVRVDGVLFKREKILKYGASRCNKHGGFGFMSDCIECYPLPPLTI